MITGFGSSGGSECELEIDDLAYKGLGVGRASGKVFFVPFTVPGDRVLIAIEKNLGSYGFGKPVRFLRSSDDRTEPPCPLFGRCGGCQIQHIRYDIQAMWKQKWVSDHLERIGGIHDAVVDSIRTGSALFSYRNKASIHRTENSVGFLERASGQVIDVPRCLLLNETVSEAYDAVRRWNSGRRNSPKKRRILIRSAADKRGIIIIHDPSIRQDEIENLNAMLPRFIVDRGGSPSTIRHRVCNTDFDVDADAFFQVNAALHQKMTDLIAELAGSGDVLVDAHSGVGWPSLCLSEQFSRIEGVDISKRSTRLANHNKERAGVGHAHFHRGSLHSFASKNRIGVSIDCLLCDPPRRGIDVRDMKAIQRLLPRRIVYISCDPATLARDLGLLVNKGYSVRSVTPIDLFPQTFHVETIVLLNRGT